MTYFQAFILAVVEGLTEFLPISSTAHLLLVQRFFTIKEPHLVSSFNIFIQLGAMMAVAFIFAKTILKAKHLWGKLVVATLPTIIIGTLVYKLIRSYLNNVDNLVAYMLIGMGIVFSLLDYYWQKKAPIKKTATDFLTEINHTSYRQMFGIGVLHSGAIIPGVSRSAACFFASRLHGLSKVAAAKLTFILGLPIIAGATLLDLFQEYHQFIKLKMANEQCLAATHLCEPATNLSANVFSSSSNLYLLTFGFVIAFITALLTAKYFMKLMSKKPFWYFGLYRLVIGLLFLSLT